MVGYRAAHGRRPGPTQPVPRRLALASRLALSPTLARNPADRRAHRHIQEGLSRRRELICPLLQPRLRQLQALVVRLTKRAKELSPAEASELVLDRLRNETAAILHEPIYALDDFSRERDCYAFAGCHDEVYVSRFVSAYSIFTFTRGGR